jgi:hypothetical protein
MKIKTNELREILSIVKPGLANKEMIEQTTSFAFLEDRIVTYNDEISISHPFESSLRGAIKAEELYGLLSKITKDEVELVAKETELLVSSGRTKAGLKLEVEVTLPLKEIPAKMKKLPDADQFNEFVSFAMRTCSNDVSQPRLTCVSINKDGVIIGSDGYRLLYCKGAELPVDSFLLPASSAAQVVKLHPTHLFLDKGWVHFENEDGTVISCRRLDDSYVPETQIQSVLNFSKDGEVKFPDKISEMIERVHQFAKRDTFLDESVDVIIESSKIALRAKSDNTNSWIEERSSIDCDKDVSFSITPSLFKEIISVTRSAAFDKSMHKIKFKGENWQYIMMLKQFKPAKK